MRRFRKILLPAATLVAAIGIGSVVQREQERSVAIAEALARPAIDQGGPSLVPPLADTLALTQPTAAPVLRLSPPIFVMAELPDDLPADLRAPRPCDPVLTADAMAGAEIAVTVSAACAKDSVVTLHHAGFMISLRTDANGAASATLPALAESAVVIASLESGVSTLASVSVPDVGDFYRAVLQTNGDTEIALHALEFGAGYDDPGHVWVGSADGGSGRFQLLGDSTVPDAYLLQVYTLPASELRHGAVDLSVEAEITASNCGQDLAAQSLQLAPGQPVEAVDLSLTMPGCDAAGDLLLLAGMFAPFEIAMN